MQSNIHCIVYCEMLNMVYELVAMLKNPMENNIPANSVCVNTQYYKNVCVLYVHLNINLYVCISIITIGCHVLLEELFM